MAEPASTEYRLEAVGLTRLFRGGVGVRDVDLTVAAGEIHALVGLNGAGKSTLMRLLLGVLTAAAGSVRVGGRDLRRAPSEVWARVGHLVDYPLAYGELTTRGNLVLGARLHAVPDDDVAGVVESAIDELALRPFADVRARVLSLGNKQRLGLASALQHHPNLIVLDEPTNALDPAGIIRMREALLVRARSDGAGILVSSHHLDEVARIADRITVLSDGRVIGALDPTGVDIERAFFDLVLADTNEAA